jgi:hypothetical protein
MVLLCSDLLVDLVDARGLVDSAAGGQWQVEN